VNLLVGQQQQWDCWLTGDSKQYAVKIVFRDQLCVCWWGSNSSGNFGCQRTVNSMQLKLSSVQLCVCVGGVATAVGMFVVSGQ